MDKYICHCTVHAFDGVSTLTSRPTVIVEANGTRDAMGKAEKLLKDEYKKSKCEVNSVGFAIVKKI